jgi:hypothetical protein
MNEFLEALIINAIREDVFVVKLDESVVVPVIEKVDLHFTVTAEISREECDTHRGRQVWFEHNDVRFSELYFETNEKMYHFDDNGTIIAFIINEIGIE